MAGRTGAGRLLKPFGAAILSPESNQVVRAVEVVSQRVKGFESKRLEMIYRFCGNFRGYSQDVLRYILTIWIRVEEAAYRASQ